MKYLTLLNIFLLPAINKSGLHLQVVFQSVCLTWQVFIIVLQDRFLFYGTAIFLSFTLLISPSIA